MFKVKEIEGWNETFVDGKIQESDLKHPTDMFLVRTLIAYLEKLGYKIESPFGDNFSADNSREKRLFLVRLAHNIDRLLKYINKSYSFLYYDLIKPVPKKTADVLGILLNNYYYYKMFRDDVFSLAYSRLHNRENLICNIETSKRENQEQQDLLEKMHKKITKLSEEVPALKAELEVWKAKAEQKKNEFTKEHDKLEELKSKLLDARTHERNLKKEIVDDSESLKLKNELAELEKNIKHHLELKNNTDIVLNERMKVITNLEELQKLLKIPQKIFPVEMLEKYKEIFAKLKLNKEQYTSISLKRTTLNETINKQVKELGYLTEKFSTKQMESELAACAQLKDTKEKECMLKSLQKELSCLNALNENMNSQLDEQKDMREYLEDVQNKIFGK